MSALSILQDDIEIVANYYPSSASIILTFKCNAMCAECCFECGPKNPFSLSKENIVNIIDRVVETNSVKFLVWTGGEAFLNYDLLLFSMKYARTKGIYSRVVSNGFWATTKEKAKQKLIPLVEAGLAELNISTGDNHQEYISFDRVMNGTVAAVELGILGVISVEKTKNSIFTIDHIFEHPLYKKLNESEYNSDLFKAVSSIWVSFHNDQQYEYDSVHLNSPELSNGCDNIFSMFVVDPRNRGLSCCGITVEYIDELQLGNITSEKNSLKRIFDTQKSDFMKQWLFVDGPVKILKQVKKWNPQIDSPKFYHFCQTCAYIFNNQDVKETILENYTDIIDDVQNRFVQKIKLKSMIKDCSV